jgi:hypothetical protein
MQGRIDRRALLTGDFKPQSWSNSSRLAKAALLASAAALEGSVSSRASAASVLPALAPSDFATLITQPQLFGAFYEAIGAVAAGTDALVREALGPSFTTLEDSGCLSVYASYVAGAVAPAGAGTAAPLILTLHELLGSHTLSPAGYCKLTALLAIMTYPQLAPPDAAVGAPAKGTIHFLVWTDAAAFSDVGHTQLVLANVLDEAYLLLDPMYGFVMCIPYSRPAAAGVSVVEHCATLLGTGIPSGNLAVVGAGPVAGQDAAISTMLGGILTVSEISDDSSNGSGAWDAHLTQTLFNLS